MIANQEAELLVKSQSGDYRSFVSLYETVYKDMYLYTRKYFQDDETVKNIIVDTILDGFVNVSKCSGNFSNWIFQILYNKIMKYQEQKDV